MTSLGPDVVLEGPRPHLGAVHESRVLLEEGWGYSTKAPPTCSTHNP